MAEQRPGVEQSLEGEVLDGRYEVIRLLGEGGMGAVYEAVHLDLDRTVAIKILKPSLSSNETYRKRFLREARAASSIDSPHIVRALDFGITSDGLFFFSMEFLQGQDLEKYLPAEPVPWDMFEPMYMQVLAALGAAHDRGIIHRDIKPANCFLCRADDGSPLVKVLDFGIAKLQVAGFGDDGPVETVENLTATNELFGTVAYMAPELVEGSAADVRSDIYALGIMLFRALTGKVPFTGANAYKVLQQHSRAPIPSLRRTTPEVSAAVESVVFRALAKDPERRYQSVDAFKKALVAAGRGVLEPSVAAFAGGTVAMDRSVSSSAMAPSVPAAAPGVEQASLSKDTGQIGRAALSPLAVFGLALLVSAGTAAAVVAVAGTGAGVSATNGQGAEARLLTPSSGLSMSPEEPSAIGGRSEIGLGEGKPAVEEQARVADEAPVRAEPVDDTVVVPKPSSSRARNNKSPSRKKPDDHKKPTRSLSEAAAERCPEAIGDNFTVNGLLRASGRYYDPEVRGGTKTARDCIRSFVLSRRFGEGRAMRSHTLQINLRH